MNIIIPMAGRGSRLRPHTLTTPKPLIQVAGKPIVEHLVEDLCKMVDETVEEIAFIIKEDFGKEVEVSLKKIASKQNAIGKIYYQNEPLGTAHAILCAKDALHGRCIVAFADTLFKANFEINQIVIKSRNPLIKRSIPNLVSPYFLAWCCTTFSPILVKPAFLANTGM